MIGATTLAALLFAVPSFEIGDCKANDLNTPTENRTVGQETPKSDMDTPPSQPDPPTATPEALAAQEKLDDLIKMMDSEAVRTNNSWQLSLNERQLFVITDAAANRMRILTPIAPATNLRGALLKRMLQANYDAVLDARYAIAQDIVWSVFIHPLSSLTEEDFLSGTAQTVIAAQTFGSSFSSGMFVYGGGDTNGIHERLLDKLQKRAQPTM